MLRSCCFDGPAVPRERLLAIAAPHVSIDGGGFTYGAAYSMLGPEYRDRTFVILGTSHYGRPERFGLTRKRFVTPLGAAVTDTALVDELETQAGEAVRMEDYCHAVEHSIEFQVVFLQHLFGPSIRILPVLCGPFARSLYEGGRPEDDENVRRFIGALGELGARENGRLLYVLGVDMAHIGRRYGEPKSVSAHTGRMTEVAETDRRRIAHLEAGDAAAFWSAVQENQDELKWCGTSPFYTFLKAVPGARGELLKYDQWNIDEDSVVSFAAMAFA
jgi:AmmeMemoRadiSam system protein B